MASPWLWLVLLSQTALADSPPWKRSDIKLDSAHRSSAYQGTLAQEVEPAEGTKVRFQLVSGSGPAWLRLSAAGKLSGMPGASDEGLQTWKVEAGDGKQTSLATLQIAIENRPPEWKSPPPQLPEAKEESAFSFSAAGAMSDPDRDKVSYFKKKGPDWLVVSPAGMLSGTPPEGSHGPFSVILEGKDAETGTQITLSGNVLQKNHPPQIPPGLAFTSKERQDFGVDLSTLVKDPNSDTLKFQLLRPKPWFTLKEDGRFSATPGFKEIGAQEIGFTVSDGKLSSKGVFVLTVTRDPRPPSWTTDPSPVSLRAREPFKYSFAGKAKDQDGLPITFKKVSGPEWLLVSADGQISGTPSDADTGTKTLIVAVANDLLSAEQKIELQVQKKNYPPERVKPLEVTAKERETTKVSIPTSGSLTDRDADALTYSFGKLPPWLELSPQGELTLSPTFAQIGKHSFSVSARDKESTVELPITVNVVRNPRAPEWTKESLEFSARSREALKISLASKAKDLDGLVIHFKKVSGPEWVAVGEKGDLTGSPADANTGKNTLVVSCSNDLAAAQKEVVFQIEKKNYPPELVKPLELTAKEREATKASVPASGGVLDRDGDALAYSATKLPAWVQLSPTGELSLTPAFAQIGKHSFVLGAKDKEKAVELPVTVTVVRNPRPPEWVAESIQFNASSREPFKANLAGKAKDRDSLPVRYKKLTGPEWVTLNELGNLSGTPVDADAGKIQLVVSAANDLAAAEKTVILQIEKKNYPPELLKPLELTVKERETTKAAVPTSGSVVDRDGEVLTYSASKLPAWVQLSPAGELTMTPLFPHIGRHSFALSAKDKEKGVEIPVSVIVVRNPRPPEWTKDPVLFTLQSRDLFKASLVGKAKDPDGLPIVFKKGVGPQWISLSPQGELTGTPSDSDEGKSTLVVFASNDSLPAEKILEIRISKKNYPPVLAKPLQITVKEREATPIALASSGCVTDADGDTLTYSATKLPVWMTLDPNGTLTLKPLFQQIGAHTITLNARDREKSVEVPGTITVARNPRPPEWKPDPLVFNMKTREPFKTSVAGKAVDLDGKPVHYSKVSGPGWLAVSDDGSLSGQPTDEQAGSTKAALKADNGEMGSVQTILLDVRVKNHPPVLHGEQLQFTLKERSNGKWDLSNKTYVQDPDKDPLKFTLKEKADWVTLTPEGMLQAQPGFKQIGKHTFTLEVRDTEAFVMAPITLVVDRDPRPPVWVAKTFGFRGKAREPFKETLVGRAQDLDGLPIVFSKKAGPEWLSLSPQGGLTGVPGDAQIGNYIAIFSVANDTLAAEAKVQIDIVPKNKPPSWSKPQFTLGSARAGEGYQAMVHELASDPDAKDVLTFEKVRGPAWLVVAPNGYLFGKPLRKDQGQQEAVIRVADPDREVAEAAVTIPVAAELNKPTPKENPIRLPAAYPGELFAYSLSKTFGDNSLSYRKIHGPTWMGLSRNGDVAGVPLGTGDFEFAFEVSNGKDTVEFAGRGKVVQ